MTRLPEVRLHLLCTNFGKHKPRLLGSYVRRISPGRPDTEQWMATAATWPRPVTVPGGEMYTKVCKTCNKRRQWLVSDVSRMMFTLDTPKLYKFDLTTKRLL